jgi:hypothetical protein
VNWFNPRFKILFSDFFSQLSESFFPHCKHSSAPTK